jgi:hypothetical protein
MWMPQPGPQTAFITCKAFEVIYGGARGGGKTDAALGDFAWHVLDYGGAARGLMVRRSRTALEPTIARARQVFASDGTFPGGAWHEAKSRFVWRSGAVLYLRHLDNDADADLYQGHDYTRVYVEELTQFPYAGPVDKLKATLRSAAGALCGFRATCNPGGPGHNWVKARYIDAGAIRVLNDTLESPFDGSSVILDRTFVPARLTDNRRLVDIDPLYVARLQQSGSAQLVKAWLEGDWNIIDGAFFDQWSARNIIAPFEIPAFWTRIRSFDWGYAVPFSVGWWAVASDDFATPRGGVIPRGALVRYREWYGSSGRAGEGLRLSAEAVARGIRQREAHETIHHGVADPSIFREDGGPSIGARLRAAGIAFRPADNTRHSGWDQMRARIAGEEAGPMLLVFDTCRDFIRTVPVLQHDPMRPEDLDTHAEDHAADEARYACLSRPFIARPPVPPRDPPDRWGWNGEAGPTPNDWKTM